MKVTIGTFNYREFRIGEVYLLAPSAGLLV
jgi:hypothetical protein